MQALQTVTDQTIVHPETANAMQGYERAKGRLPLFAAAYAYVADEPKLQSALSATEEHHKAYVNELKKAAGRLAKTAAPRGEFEALRGRVMREHTAARAAEAAGTLDAKEALSMRNRVIAAEAAWRFVESKAMHNEGMATNELSILKDGASDREWEDTMGTARALFGKCLQHGERDEDPAFVKNQGLDLFFDIMEQRSLTEVRSQDDLERQVGRFLACAASLVPEAKQIEEEERAQWKLYEASLKASYKGESVEEPDREAFSSQFWIDTFIANASDALARAK